MQTSDLIHRLAADLQPLPARAALSRLAAGLFVGGLIALGLVWLILGPRSDFSAAVLTVAFWSKWTYALAVTVMALWLCLRLARPDGTPGVLLMALAVPLLVLWSAALVELRAAPPGERAAMWLGQSALKCPWLIAALAIPVFAGILWAFRRFAPTRPRLAGFSAGCLAGAVAAIVYAIHCNETAASFVASWYTAGMLAPALVGMLIGPRVLRW
jgi:hypothetical protein